MIWLTDFSKKLLLTHYCRDNETIPETFNRACTCWAAGDTKLRDRLMYYISNGWFMFASPLISNAILKGETPKGMPISCFKSYVDDSIKGLNEHTVETRLLSVKGGGVGGHWSSVRSQSDVTPGVNGFLHTTDADMVAYRQGKTRRGAYAAYLDVSHPEIIEFIKMRTPTGDLNRKSLNLHHGVNITDDFLEAVDKGSKWSLIDPASLKTVEVVDARHLWEEIITTRFRTGEPYINYIDEANDKLHPALKAKGLRIWGSNVCNEIHLPTNEDRTAVCCLSSVNLSEYDSWKDTNMVQDLVTMLDNVLDFFIKYAPDELEKAKYSAMRERSIGIGAMGYSDYLQWNNIPWETAMALSINKGQFRTIKELSLDGTRTLADTRGEAPDGIGYGVRNLHLLAIAPNSNSSIILGCSSSIEPRNSNCYTHKTRVGSHLVKNPILIPVLEKYKKNTDEVWKSIMNNDGSVQHLEFLTDNDKEVFKTARELDQRWVVDHARVRQEFVCQGQSVNVFFNSGADKTYVSNVHRRAFSNKGIGVPLKGLYYLHTTSSKKTENLSNKIEREALKDGVDECLGCQG